MNKNIESYKKALDNLKFDENLKRKTLDNIFKNTNTEKYCDKFKLSKLEPRKNRVRTTIYSLITVLASVVIVFSVLLANDNMNRTDLLLVADNNQEAVLPIKENDILPKVGSMENLKKILDDMNVQLSAQSKDMEESLRADTTKFLDHSQTNIQVSGVDEADIVKTDGNYIYCIENKKVLVINVKDPQNIKIESTIEYEESARPKELYINDNKLVVILDKSDVNKYNNSTICYDMIVYDSETLVITYDMRSKENLAEKRKIEVEGRYVSSRMINDEVYVVTTKTIYNADENNILPQYRDSTIDNEKHAIDLEKLLYVPGSNDNSYVTIVGFSVKNTEEANIKTILGAGQQVYCTKNNLYITSTKYETQKNNLDSSSSVSYVQPKYFTTIYKFKLEDTRISSIAVGKVDGRILNQFSMGEYNGNLAIATTEEKWVANNMNIKNNIYILDENLKQIGILENIAENEQLYAVRFINDKAYVVTFKRIDSLFVIDISNPNEPKILGELKIPGYSSYLHPYDENHIIGIGQDVQVEQTKYGERDVTKGIKVSLFDVSDYANPKEKYSLVIGEKSYTDAQYDHKAILFSKEKNIFAFPMSNSIGNENKQEYIILSIDLENGISIKKRINHGYEETEHSKYMPNIDRGLYINDNLFTISNKKIEAMNLENFEKISELVIN